MRPAGNRPPALTPSLHERAPPPAAVVTYHGRWEGGRDGDLSCLSDGFPVFSGAGEGPSGNQIVAEIAPSGSLAPDSACPLSHAAPASWWLQ